MPPEVRVYIAFAGKDAKFRDLLVGKARNAHLTVSFVETTMKSPGDAQWEAQVRSKIKTCAAALVLVSAHTAHVPGVLTEIKAAREENIPMRGIYVDFVHRPLHLPPVLEGLTIIQWKWRDILAYFQSLEETARAKESPASEDKTKHT